MVLVLHLGKEVLELLLEFMPLLMLLELLMLMCMEKCLSRLDLLHQRLYSLLLPPPPPSLPPEVEPLKVFYVLSIGGCCPGSSCRSQYGNAKIETSLSLGHYQILKMATIQQNREEEEEEGD